MNKIIFSERGLSSIVVALFLLLIIIGAVFTTAAFSPFAKDSTDRTGQPVTASDYRTEPRSYDTVSQSNIYPTKTSPQSEVTDMPMETPVPTPTQIPTLTPTSTPTPTQTPTSTATEATSEYYEFAIEFFGQLNVRSPVAVQLRGVEIRDEAMWVVVNSTSPSVNRSDLRSERNSIANMYARTYQVHQAGKIDGQRPRKLRYIEANTTSNASPKTYTVSNSLVQRYVGNGRSAVWYTDKWRQTLRDATVREEKIAINIDRGSENNTLGPKAR